MRALVTRLVLWLCARYDIVPLDEQRTNMGGDEVARSQRWEAFAREEGGLFDMIEKQRREAFMAYADTPPDQQATKDHLAMQDRALRQVRTRVESVIATGKIKAQNEQQRAATPGSLRAI